MNEAVNNLRIGDSVISRVTGNPYCKDRATGDVVKVNGSFVRIRLQDGLEIAVKREWIEYQIGIDQGSGESVTVNGNGEIVK